MSQLVERMRAFGPTIFAEVTALALKTGAVNLGQGFPDTDGPASMLARAVAGINGGLNQYPPGPGMLPLRQAIAAQRQARYRTDYDPAEEILVTVGATEAVAASMLALCEPGDEVIVFEPYYDSYPAVIAMAGAIRRPVTLRPDGPGGRFAFDPDELRNAVGPRTRLILVNTPHNPTGSVFSRAELDVIAGLCREHDLLAVTDEVYEYLTFDGAQHIPLATLPGMRERTVSVSSAGKTFSVTGWKVGWICAPAELIRAVTTVKQFLTFTAAGAFQAAVAGALVDEMNWVERLRASLQERRDRLSAGLEGIGLIVHRPAGTYFVQADVRGIGIEDGETFARALPEAAGVAAIPTSLFYDEPGTGRPFVRFAFCKQDEVLDEAVRRLAAHAADLRGA
ncbi:MAG TPA: pyridoxal phosphate-dependent aminotransferase [Mycobacteriales bacterium]|nr:pyridoxal phosphate-dependent aminotransferase [Mycobacteriales bacterium]